MVFLISEASNKTVPCFKGDSIRKYIHTLVDEGYLEQSAKKWLRIYTVTERGKSLLNQKKTQIITYEPKLYPKRNRRKMAEFLGE